MADPELNVDALADVYRAEYPHFLRVAEAIAGDVEAGRDAVHDGFVNAIRRRETFRGTGPLEAWVWRCIVNAAKRAPRRGTTAELPEQQSPHPAEPDESVRAAVARLPERQRLALFLRYYSDLDYEAIASVLNISVGAVGASLNKAHRRLRASLEEVNVGQS